MGRFNQLIEVLFEASIIPAESYNQILAGTDIIQNAKKEAHCIIAHAQDMYEQKKVQAYDEAQIKFNSDCIDKSIDLSMVTLKAIKNVEKQLLDTVVYCIQKIVTEYIPDKALVALVRKAIKCIQNENKIVLKLHDSQIAKSNDELQDIIKGFPDMIIDIVGDREVPIGDCIVSTKFCLIHTGINHYLTLLKKKAEKINNTI